MGDKLERYIRDHRDEFDELHPSAESWRRLASRIEKPKRNVVFVWKIAAIFFLVSTIYLSIERNYYTKEYRDQQVGLNEFDQAEKYYFELISDKKARLNDLDVKNRNADLIEEEQRLDLMYQKLKKEYLKKSGSEKVRDAMLQNLRLRLQVLSEQIKILSGISKGENNEDIEI